MSTEKITMQQQFEEWARSQCMQLKKDGVVTTYAYERTDLAWNAWQASRAAIEVLLPEPYDSFSGVFHAEDGEDPDISMSAHDVRQAIESLGLKVKP
jgi:hypothetical protein